MRIVMFSKHLLELPPLDAGRAARRLGFAGLDLTVRPGGHVPPDRIETDLPKTVEALRAEGVEVPMLTTAITSAADPICRPTLAVAARLGIRELKLGYWPYRGIGTLRSALDAARREMDGLEAAARTAGVRVSLHFHSGSYLTAVAANVRELLRDRDPHHVGAYIDPGHMTLEGGGSGWLQGMDMVSDYISMMAVKAFGPFSDEAPGGGLRWNHRIVPLRRGTVRWGDVLDTLRTLKWDGIVTFHSEYQGSGSFRDLTLAELLEQTRDDLAFLLPLIRERGFAL